MSAVRVAAVMGVVGTAVGLLALAACASSPDENRLTVVITPDFDTYVASVDAYLTRRCGSLD